MSQPDYNLRTELRVIAIITARAFALVIVAALLWRLTLENSGWGLIFALPAMIFSVLAFAACLVGSGLWRNSVVMTLGLTGNRSAAYLVAAPTVVLMVLCAGGLIWLTGRLSSG